MREMKDSGIEWIGEIPKAWNIEKSKYNFLNNKIVPGIRSSEYQRLSLTLKGVLKRNKEDSDGLQPKDFDTYQLLKKNELVFKLIDLQNIATSRVGLAHDTGLVSPAYIVLKPNENICPQFAEYYFLMLWHRNIFNALGDAGVRSSLNLSDLLDTPICFPTFTEQCRIADFLDAKCAEIDFLTADIQTQIETLEEYKRSVITEAVTKGLNPEAELKDSGIEWIDFIPSEWSHSRLGYESYIRARLGWKGLKADEYVDEGYAFISAFNIQNGRLVWEPLNYITKERYDESPEIKLQVGDVIIVKDGAGVGKCTRVDELPLGGTAPNSSIGVITPYKSLDYRYLTYYLQSEIFNNFVLKLSNGMGVPHLTQEVMRNIKILIPPILEQQEIANWLDAKCEEINDAMEEKKQQLEVLEYYKKSLIYEYVTGKKQVPTNA